MQYGRGSKRGKLTPHQSSIILDLKPIMAARSIVHPTAFLLKIGINRFSATKLLNGSAVQVNFRQLTILCEHLNCTPNDLFVTRKMQLPADHQLNKLQEADTQVLDPKTLFNRKSLDEIRDMLKDKDEE